MQTADAGLLFQSESAQDRVAARLEKSNRPLFPGLSEPIQVSSKPLALQLDGQHVWYSESNGSAKKVELASGRTRKIFKGHKGPATSLALYELNQRKVLITGSWDKSIRFFDTESKEELCCIENAHTDFVKVLLVIPALHILVSGGSDKDVRLWDLRKLSVSSPLHAPTFLASLRSHTRPVDCLAALPMESPICQNFSLWTADTMGKVCVWSIRREGEDQLQHSRIIEWRPHETAITSLSLHTFPEEPGRAAEMWTSSADHTVQLHTFDPSFTAAIQITEPALRLRIPHPDLVRCVVPEYEHMLLFTGSADEQVRIWDLEELLQSPPPQKRGWTEDKNTALFERAIVAQVDEHYHDVHILTPFVRLNTETHELESCLLSGSMDGTLRVWTIKQLQEWNTKGRPGVRGEEAGSAGGKAGQGQGDSLMSAEEEAELEALMDD